MWQLRQRLRSLVGAGPDDVLRRARGVIHVGANTGQERDLYASLGLKVVWVEPIPEVFDELERNLSAYPDQRAVRALVTDRSGEKVTFHVSSNDGLSSSIFEFDQHADIWPDVTTAHSIELVTTTLTDLVRHEAIDLNLYDSLVMDTQGSELLVLQGAEAVLPDFTLIKSEAADFEAYAGCCRRDHIEQFLGVRGFTEIQATKFASHPNGGHYYDLVFERS